MAIVDVIDIKGKKVSEIDLSDHLFNVTIKPSILHEVVKMQLATRRSGTASVKMRSEIKGSGRKLFRQKGTGRARRGNIKSPLLRGGGVTFGPSPRSYAYKVPKKIKKLALKMAISTKLKDNTLFIIDKFELEKIKTKAFVEVLKGLKFSNPLIVTDKADEKLELSSRNVPKVKILRYEGLNVYDILKSKELILLESSVQGVERRLGA
jgi:large subunit ribosomal protein L4